MLNVQGGRLAGGRRAPPRIWTFLSGLRGLTGSCPGRPLKTSGATKVEAGRSQADSLAEPPRLAAEGARGPDRGQRVRHEAVDADARQLERDRRIEPVRAAGQEIERPEPDEQRPGAGQSHARLGLRDGEGVSPARVVVVERGVE